MLYEYGIMSIYLQGIKDKRMATHEYVSSFPFLSFRVPLHPKKRRIQGLNVTFLYRSLGEGGRDILPPLAKIRNITKGVTWVYSPVVYCKPKVDNDVAWLSYWPVQDIFDEGDEVFVDIYVDNRMMQGRVCGASLVYMDNDEVEKEEKCGNKTRMSRKEVIGGDLSLFKVTEGGYYLCRRDLFKKSTPYVLKNIFGDKFQYARGNLLASRTRCVHS